jgi:MFS family permease
MWEQQLTSPKRVLFRVEAVIGFVMAIGFIAGAALAPRGLPMLARLGFVAGAVVCAASGVMLLRMSRRGTMNLRHDPLRLAGLTWGGVVIMVTLFMMLGGLLPDRTIGIQMVVNGIVFLVGVGLILLRAVIEQSQLKTQEKLLEIEYRLAELAEQVRKPTESIDK